MKYQVKEYKKPRDQQQSSISAQQSPSLFPSFPLFFISSILVPSALPFPQRNRFSARLRLWSVRARVRISSSSQTTLFLLLFSVQQGVACSKGWRAARRWRWKKRSTTTTAWADAFFSFHRSRSDLPKAQTIAARTAIRQQQHQRSLARSGRQTGEASFEGPKAAGGLKEKTVTIHCYRFRPSLARSLAFFSPSPLSLSRLSRFGPKTDERINRTVKTESITVLEKKTTHRLIRSSADPCCCSRASSPPPPAPRPAPAPPAPPSSVRSLGGAARGAERRTTP